MEFEDADFLLSRAWFNKVEDVYLILGNVSDDDFWELYKQRSKYNHLVCMGFSNCITFPKPKINITLNVIEEEEKVFKISDIQKAWAKYFKTIKVETHEFEK